MKKVVNFTIEEDIWEQCREIKKKIKVNWSSLIEEYLIQCIKDINEYQPEVVEIFQKPTVNLKDIKKIRLETIERMHKQIQQETKRMSKTIEEIKEETNQILEHLEKRQEEILLSGKEEIEKNA